MYHKILETDEAIKDIHHISCEAYAFTRDKKSGLAFLKLYDATAENIAIFPNGFSTTDIEYRGYVIHILPFGNYNLFYTINDKSKKNLCTSNPLSKTELAANSKGGQYLSYSWQENYSVKH